MSRKLMSVSWLGNVRNAVASMGTYVVDPIEGVFGSELVKQGFGIQ